MRVWMVAFLTAASLWLAPAPSAQAKEMTRLDLHCPKDPGPNIAALCQALRAQLVQRGHDLTGDGADWVVTLQGRDLGPSGLTAQLIVMRSAGHMTSPELTLTVSGRDDIPAAQLLRFADDLIASSALARK